MQDEKLGDPASAPEVSTAGKSRTATYALIISGFSLAVSASGLALAYSTSIMARKHANVELLQQFTTQASALPSSERCFALGTHMEENAFEQAFSVRASKMTFSGDDATDASQCLQIDTEEDQIELSQIKMTEIRRKILNKLNSYEAALIQVRDGLVDAHEVCPTILASFKGPARNFIGKIESANHRPALFENIANDLPLVMSELKGGPCT